MSSAIRSPAADSAFWRRGRHHNLLPPILRSRAVIASKFFSGGHVERRFHVRNIERRSLLLSWPEDQPGKSAIPASGGRQDLEGLLPGLADEMRWHPGQRHPLRREAQ